MTCDDTTFELTGRGSVFSRVSDFSYAPRDATVTVTSRDGGAFAIPSARCTRRLRTAVWSRRGRPGGAARGRPGQPPGQQLLLARGVRVRQAHRGRGAHPGRELVLLPAAQARRDPRGRGRTRGDLLLRDRGPGLPAGLRHPGPPDRRAGRGEHGRRDPDPARLARPVDRRTRLRPVLPQRDGGPRADQVLAVLRRPGPRLDPRHLGGPADRPAPAPHLSDGRNSA